MFAVVLLQAGCLRTGEQKRAAVQTVDDAARQYVRLVLALGERDPDSLDFAAVPELLRKTSHERYSTLDEIGRQAATLQQELRGLKENRAQALAEEVWTSLCRRVEGAGRAAGISDCTGGNVAGQDPVLRRRGRRAVPCAQAAGHAGTRA